MEPEAEVLNHPSSSATHHSPNKRYIRSGSIVDKTWSPLIAHAKHDHGIEFELPLSNQRRSVYEIPKAQRPEFHKQATTSADFKKKFLTSSDAIVEQGETEIVDKYKDENIVEKDKVDDSNQAADNNPLGTIQPEIYNCRKTSELPHCGSVCFSLIYDGAIENLIIKVIKAKHLLPRASSKDPTRDSFVQVYLLPDERNFHQTQTRTNSNNPIFNEEFVFQISNANVHHKTLRLSLYDEGKKKSSCVLLGHALIGLDDIDLSKPNHEIWSDLLFVARPGDVETPLGSIQFALTYTPRTGRLGVFIVQLKDFRLLHAGAAVIARKHHGGTLRRVSSMLRQTVRKEEQSDYVCGHVTVGGSESKEVDDLHHWRETLAHLGRSATKWHVLHKPAPNV